MDLRLCEPATVEDGDISVNGSPVSARASDDAPGLLSAAINAGCTSCGIAGGAFSRGVGATLGVESSTAAEGRLEVDADLGNTASLDESDLVFSALAVPFDVTKGEPGRAVAVFPAPTSPQSPAEVFRGTGDLAIVL
jgi:hypothetical protein